ncbi:MAG: hypothetical protein OXC15_18145, partial [Rhodospirillaceae bacterium]|nr:hypothetical protein [Rhodospirillaceae bacterium]
SKPPQQATITRSQAQEGHLAARAETRLEANAQSLNPSHHHQTTEGLRFLESLRVWTAEKTVITS